MARAAYAWEPNMARTQLMKPKSVEPIKDVVDQLLDDIKSGLVQVANQKLDGFEIERTLNDPVRERAVKVRINVEQGYYDPDAE